METKRILLMLYSFTVIFADRGLIPLEPDVTIFEPNQRAMICWNGKEEILLLSTDLQASDSTMVLEILPLPSEPKVKKGDLETFRRAANFINQRIHASRRNNGEKSESSVVLPPAELTFHEKIGAHDISVVHLTEAGGFVDWVENYLKTIGYTNKIISDTHKGLIAEYISEGFVWFVFDVITLNVQKNTLEPIQYRFTTDRLFYPLKITRLNTGSTTIELLVLTPRLLSNFTGLSISHIQLAHEPLSISSHDIKNIDEDMYELLRDYDFMKIRIWKIEGALNSFNKDLVAN